MGFLSDYSLTISTGSALALFVCMIILFFTIPSDIREAKKKGGAARYKDLTGVIISIRVMVGFIFLGTVGLISQATC